MPTPEELDALEMLVVSNGWRVLVQLAEQRRQLDMRSLCSGNTLKPEFSARTVKVVNFLQGLDWLINEPHRQLEKSRKELD